MTRTATATATATRAARAATPSSQLPPSLAISSSSSSSSSSGKPSMQPSAYRPPQGTLFRAVPHQVVPYLELMRLDRPSGFYAFFWHYAIGLGYAASVASPTPSPTRVLILAAYMIPWVAVLRGTVCTINDNLDQEFDRQVARTRFRPIARGAVSTRAANYFTLFLLLLGVGLTLPLPRPAWPHAVMIYAVLSIYPLGKRFTDFPQVILGLGFAIPVFFCCALVDVRAQAPAPSSPEQRRVRDGAAAVYLASAIWTVIFDTVYAHQDIKDDIKAGVKSLAVRLGESTIPVLGSLAVVQVALLAWVGHYCDFHPSYFVLTVLGSGMVLAIMLLTVNLKQPKDCAWWFGPGSKMVGMFLTSGFVCQYFVNQV